MDFVKQKGGIDYTIKTMNSLKDEALNMLHSMPENDSRSSLELLINYSINRQK